MQIGHLSVCNSKDGVLSVMVNDEGLPFQTAAVRWKFTKSLDFLPLDLRLTIQFWYHPTSGLMQILHFDWLRY